MTNKYLEKIAKELSSDEKKSRGAAWGTFGRSGLGATVAGVVPLAAPIGGVYGYRTGIKKHAPNVKEKDLTGQAVRGYARQQGRSMAEGVGGGVAGAAAGAGALKLLSKAKKIAPQRANKWMAAGAYAGGITGAAAGAIHGAYKSTKNKLDELTGRKKK